jgi:hypothetical protein
VILRDFMSPSIRLRMVSAYAFRNVEIAPASPPRPSDIMTVSNASMTSVLGEPPSLALTGDQDLRHDVHLRHLNNH